MDFSYGHNNGGMSQFQLCLRGQSGAEEEEVLMLQALLSHASKNPFMQKSEEKV